VRAWSCPDLLLPGGEGAELSGLGDGPALAGGRVLLPLDGRPVGHEIFFVAVGSHGSGCGGEARSARPSSPADAAADKSVRECQERERAMWTGLRFGLSRCLGTCWAGLPFGLFYLFFLEKTTPCVVFYGKKSFLPRS
jgi:hypothetical protein